MIDYTLAVLTHGDGAPLVGAINSLRDKVKPQPARTVIHWDGPTGAFDATGGALGVDVLDVSVQQRGFCQATRQLWRLASQAETEFVFWLEHDFRFLRPVDLADLAEPLRVDSTLAQMQLMRNAVNDEEIAAGGLYEMRRADYANVARLDRPQIEWLSHRAYFTTNPSLMRTAWMVEHPWLADGEAACEGRFSIGLVERGFHYGVWGSGEPWVEHVGVRTGFGY